MFRRTLRRFQSSSKNYHQSDKERTRIHDERRRNLSYDAEGNLRLTGVLLLIWEDYGTPIMWVTGFFLFAFGYNRLITYLNKGERERQAKIDKESEQYARESGKLQADRFLVKPRRQIEDPDFLNVPSFAGKGVYKSKLFDDDELSSSDLVSEIRRN